MNVSFCGLDLFRYHAVKHWIMQPENKRDMDGDKKIITNIRKINFQTHSSNNLKHRSQ